MVKMEQQLKTLKQREGRLKAIVQEKAEKELVHQRRSGKKEAKAVARAFQDAQEERRRREEETRARKQAETRARKQALGAKPASRPLKTYSAQAARVSTAGLKVGASKRKSAMDILGPAPTKVAKISSSNAQRRRESSDEDAALGRMSLNVSSAKRRKIEPLPLGKDRKSSKVKGPARKETKMHDFFGRSNSR